MPSTQPSAASQRAAARWTSRLIPVVITALVGYATYVIVDRICIKYLHDSRKESASVVVFLILYFLFLFMSAWSYARTLWTVHFNTGLVPLGPGAEAAAEERRHREKRAKVGDIESQPYDPHSDGPDPDPDSPGLEKFYTKDVFLCESDGRPRWCSECRTWKPDRAHHSSEIGRCVRKMDHYCPWVGGMVSETSFKFFCQFTFYCSLYTAIALAISAYALHFQLQGRGSPDAQVIAAVAVASLFFLFTSTMTMTSWRFVFINVTNIDMLKKAWVYQLAVRVPCGTPSTDAYTTITYPLPKAPLRRPKAPRPNGHAPLAQPVAPPSPPPSPPEDVPIPERDQSATRTFAVVRTDHDENPWDLGWKRNWQEVMGSTLIDWLLPIRKSPCTVHESPRSDYPMGPLLETLRERHGLDRLAPDETADGVAMRYMARGQRSQKRPQEPQEPQKPQEPQE